MKPPVITEDQQRAARLRLQGKTFSEIAEEEGISRGVAYYRVHMAEIKGRRIRRQQKSEAASGD